MFLLLAQPVIAETVSCSALKQAYQTVTLEDSTTGCCSNPGGVIDSTSCVASKTEVSTLESRVFGSTDLEKRCIALGNEKFREGDADQIQIKKDSYGHYCLVTGNLKDDLPFSAAFPMNTSMYEERLIGRGGYGDDTEDGQLETRRGDLTLMKKHKAVFAHMATHGNYANHFTDAWPANNAFGDRIAQSGLSPEGGDLRIMNNFHGGAWRAYKKLLNTFSDRIYQKPFKYSYMQGCSGAGRNAMTNVLTDPDEWSGVYARDFFEYSIHTAKAGLLLPKYRQQVTQETYDKNLALSNVYCDSVEFGDGIDDAVSQWDCKYSPAKFQCGSTAQIEGYNGSVCFTEEELTHMEPLYSNGISLPDGNFMHLTDAEQEVLVVPPNTERHMVKELASNYDWIYYAISGNLGVYNNPSHPVSRMVQDIHIPETRKPKAERDDFRAYSEVIMKPNSSHFRDFMAVWKVHEPISDPSVEIIEKLVKNNVKLLMHANLGDPIASPSEVGRLLWHKMWDATGRNRQLMDYYVRLYLNPSYDHCRTGSGNSSMVGSERSNPDKTDLDFLIDWVESEIPPTYDYMVKDRGDTIREDLPVCAYPSVAKRGVNDTVAKCVCDHHSERFGSYCDGSPYSRMSFLDYAFEVKAPMYKVNMEWIAGYGTPSFPEKGSYFATDADVTRFGAQLVTWGYASTESEGIAYAVQEGWLLTASAPYLRVNKEWLANYGDPPFPSKGDFFADDAEVNRFLQQLMSWGYGTTLEEARQIAINDGDVTLLSTPLYKVNTEWISGYGTPPFPDKGDIFTTDSDVTRFGDQLVEWGYATTASEGIAYAGTEGWLIASPH